jgi:hypothetical protein
MAAIATVGESLMAVVVLTLIPWAVQQQIELISFNNVLPKDPRQAGLGQGTFTEGEGSVQLTSLTCTN